MKKYFVNYSIIWRYTVEVEAENEEEAIELANEDFELANFWELEYWDHSIEVIEDK